MYKQEWYDTFNEKHESSCVVCSKETGAYYRKYCSSECKKSAGTVGRRKKGSGVTKTAICVGCGNEFTRPASYPSKMKYCSNRCSHSEIKKQVTRFIMEAPEYAVVFRSMYEVRFAAACERHGVPWRKYDLEEIVTPVGNYRPDFIIEMHGAEIIVELKGHMDFESLQKTEAAREQLGERYVVMFRDDLLTFEEDPTEVVGTGNFGKIVKA